MFKCEYVWLAVHQVANALPAGSARLRRSAIASGQIATASATIARAAATAILVSHVVNATAVLLPVASAIVSPAAGMQRGSAVTHWLLKSPNVIEIRHPALPASRCGNLEQERNGDPIVQVARNKQKRSIRRIVKDVQHQTPRLHLLRGAAPPPRQLHQPLLLLLVRFSSRAPCSIMALRSGGCEKQTRRHQCSMRAAQVLQNAGAGELGGEVHNVRSTPSRLVLVRRC